MASDLHVKAHYGRKLDRLGWSDFRAGSVRPMHKRAEEAFGHIVMEATMTEIFERREMRNREQVFQDRDDAGQLLARMLSERYSDTSDIVVLALPIGVFQLRSE